VIFLLAHRVAFGQERPSDTDTRHRLPGLLRNTYFAANLGYLDQSFAQEQLDPPFRASAIDVPRLAARVALVGHELNPYLAVQLSYQRPVLYVTYTGLGAGGGDRHHVRANFGSLTLKVRTPRLHRWSVYAEGGLGLTSRTGFTVGKVIAVADASYSSLAVGGGLERRIGQSWDLIGGVSLEPARASVHQPHTLFSSLGLRYVLRPPSPGTPDDRGDHAAFPWHLLQVEYSSGVGYGVNNFVSKTVPIFWGGDAQVDQGLAAHFEQNVYHTRRMFALDVGVSTGTYRTRNFHERFVTASVYPLLRLFLVRGKSADFYFAYALAGPTYIGRTRLDGLDTGRHFTFQDFMGVGLFLGARRHLNLNLKLNHYSNGNIFPQNAAVMIPLTFGVGYTF
jgi:hypothetical protein